MNIAMLLVVCAAALWRCGAPPAPKRVDIPHLTTPQAVQRDEASTAPKGSLVLLPVKGLQSGITVSDGHVYFFDQSGVLVRVSTQGASAPTSIVYPNETDDPILLSVTRSHVAWGNQSLQASALPSMQPFTVDTNEIAGVVTDEVAVYWVRIEHRHQWPLGGSVMKRNWNSNSVVHLTDVPSPGFGPIGHDASTLYVLDFNESQSTRGSIVAVPKAGGAPRRLVTLEAPAYQLRVGHHELYWLMGSSGVLYHASKTATNGKPAVVPLPSECDDTLNDAIADENLYVVCRQSLIRIPHDSTKAVHLRTEPQGIGALALDNDFIYYVVGAGKATGIAKISKTAEE